MRRASSLLIAALLTAVVAAALNAPAGARPAAGPPAGTSGPLTNCAPLTPRARPDNVFLICLHVYPRNGELLLVWETATEFNNQGFFVVRGTSPNGSFTRVSLFIDTLDPSGQVGAHYEYIDPDLTNGTTYCYKLEAIDAGQHSDFVPTVAECAAPSAGSTTPTTAATTPAASATPTSSPAPTNTPPPGASSTYTPIPTDTPAPTHTPAPGATAMATQPEATETRPAPTATVPPGSTATPFVPASSTPEPKATPVSLPTDTPVPGATAQPPAGTPPPEASAQPLPTDGKLPGGGPNTGDLTPGSPVATATPKINTGGPLPTLTASASTPRATRVVGDSGNDGTPPAAPLLIAAAVGALFLLIGAFLAYRRRRGPRPESGA
jgi:hypothetical protein